MALTFLGATLGALPTILLSATGAGVIQDPALEQLSGPGREAYQILLTAERFIDDAIDDGGVTPNEVIALRKLLKNPRADVALEELERRATLPGRLFALCGLYYPSPDVFH